MKKYLFILYVIIVFIFTGCNNSNQTDEDYSSKENRTIYMTNIGLKLIKPKNWTENIMVTQDVSTDENEKIFSKVNFIYCNDENLDIITAPNFDGNMEDYTVDISKILVVKDENIEAEEIKDELNEFKQNKTIKQNNGFSYIALWENSGNLNQVGENYMSDYNSKLENIDELLKSDEFIDFDAEKTIADIKKRGNLLSFDTVDIDGNQVNSSIFANYDITMVNFWGTYVSDNINETETLEDINSRIAAMNDANFFQVVIDLPSEENEKILRQTREEKNATYLCLIPDINLANFATSNLEGVPTTIFVDRTGAVVGEQIKGMQSADQYMTTLLEELEKLKQEQKTAQ